MRREAISFPSTTLEAVFSLILLGKGKIVNQGTPDEVLSQVNDIMDLSLELPFAYQLSEALNKESVKIDKYINQEKLVNELCQLHLKK